MKRILITGASGYIGRSLAIRLSGSHTVMGLYRDQLPKETTGITWEKADLTCAETMEKVIQTFLPDVVIHSAAIAHQSLKRIDRQTYFDVNSLATEKLAEIASRFNPDVQFLFLSSVSVYGEKDLSVPVDETHACHPSSDYGASKLDAENRLRKLHDSGQLKYLGIFRLAPVYDASWSLNLDRRVFGPGKVCYLRFGSGRQSMSALAKANLGDLVCFWVGKAVDTSENKIIFNICDRNPYSFREIITTFRQSRKQPSRPVVICPLFLIFIATRIAGLLFPSKKDWLHAVHEKLAISLVFDNKRMLATGFTPVHDLKAVYGVGAGT